MRRRLTHQWHPRRRLPHRAAPPFLAPPVCHQLPAHVRRMRLCGVKRGRKHTARSSKLVSVKQPTPRGDKRGSENAQAALHLTRTPTLPMPARDCGPTRGAHAARLAWSRTHDNAASWLRRRSAKAGATSRLTTIATAKNRRANRPHRAHALTCPLWVGLRVAYRRRGALLLLKRVIRVGHHLAWSRRCCRQHDSNGPAGSNQVLFVL